MNTNSFPYGFRIVGPCSGERRLVDAAAAFRGYAGCVDGANVHSEAYLSAFQFSKDFADYLRTHGTTKGYSGPCHASYAWWDIDADGDLDMAADNARRLCEWLRNTGGVDERVILVFFSGAKGFHVGIPTALWEPEPAADFHKVMRAFCESIAAAAGATVDSGIYDRVRAFRAPNSRHAKTGLYKRRLDVDALLNLSVDGIVALAKEPEPFDVPEVKGTMCCWEIPDAWDKALETVGTAAQATLAVKERRLSGELPSGLNRQTLEFIRNGANQGDRHRLLYSAAANLGEFGCPSVLAHALLTEPARDSGLTPSDVKRGIDCGLNDAAVKGAVS